MIWLYTIHVGTNNNYGKKSAGIVGAVAGAMGGFSAVYGARAGMSLGVVAWPGGVTLAGVSGCLVSTRLGGVSGASTGMALGEVLDDHVLDSFRCLIFDLPSVLVTQIHIQSVPPEL